jgi:BirA family biotin operon repressor/biotin-[acetyl-CoA-carboxylase] ligase
MIIGSKSLFFKNLPSTNTQAALLLKNNDLVEGTIIHTNYQLAGRGQLGNQWESAENKNLLISIILYPSMVTASEQFIISKVVSLGICDFLKRYIPECRIKWPNDIYVNNDKIAGLLIENSVMGDIIENSIIGIGLNINQKKFFSDAPNPVSLRMLTGKELDLPNCLDELSYNLDKRYKQLIGGDYSKISTDYISQLFRLNEWFGYRDINGQFSGRLLTVAEFGRLKIETQSGEIKDYAFKEVEFIL